MSDRRGFLATSGAALAAVATASGAYSPNVIAQPKIQWRMSTLWPPALDVNLSAGQGLAKCVEEMSGGRFRIEVFPAGQIMGALECFDAASQGKIEAFHAA